MTISDVYILEIVYKYIKAGWHLPFTYDSITSFIKINKLCDLKQQTIEKYLRDLSRLGFFKREYRKNPRGKGYIVYYYPTEKFYEFFKGR